MCKGFFVRTCPFCSLTKQTKIWFFKYFLVRLTAAVLYIKSNGLLPLSATELHCWKWAKLSFNFSSIECLVLYIYNTVLPITHSRGGKILNPADSSPWKAQNASSYLRAKVSCTISQNNTTPKAACSKAVPKILSPQSILHLQCPIRIVAFPFPYKIAAD